MVSQTSLQTYLDRSLDVLKKFNLLPKDNEKTGLVTLLDEVTDVDEPKVLTIAQTVQYMGQFNELVRSHIREIKVSDRYSDITSKFDGIREDSKVLVDQLADGKIDIKEKMYNWQMKLFRGTPHKRFEQIRNLYLSVSNDTKKALDREIEIMSAYMDFRSAVKKAEALSYDVQSIQRNNLDNAKSIFDQAQEKVAIYQGSDMSEKSRLELSRDEARRAYDKEEAKMQLITDVAESLKVGYNVGETLVAKFKQTHDLKRQVYNRSVTFFQTNEHVFTVMDGVYTSQRGLHESTQTLNSMADGMNKGIEQIAELGGQLEQAAIKAGYGKQLDAKSVQKLVDAIVGFQTDSLKMINEYRQESTNNALEIERIVEEGKKKSHDALMKYQPIFSK